MKRRATYKKLALSRETLRSLAGGLATAGNIGVAPFSKPVATDPCIDCTRTQVAKDCGTIVVGAGQIGVVGD